MSASLDQLVKGAPAPESKLSASSSPPPASSAFDPLSTLPSSPPQIYLNLLILESSLRAQYLALRERRRQNTFFCMLLALWIAYFSYALFLRPREDGRGVGGSVYWVVEMGEKVALMGGIVTGILIWGTGQWERGVRWPRRWLAVANRGLRGMNTKIVVIRGPWWRELLSYLSFLFPYSSFFTGGNFHYVEPEMIKRVGGRQHYNNNYYYDGHSDDGLVEEDLAPGGDYIRLLLLPKSFSPEFRENWDEYRTDYWEKENERRAQLRRRLRERERQLARQEGGWLWWLGLGYWRSSSRRRRERAAAEKSRRHHHHHHHHHSKSHSLHARRGTRSDSTPSRDTTPVDGQEERPPSWSSLSGRRSSISGTEQQGQQSRRKKSPKASSSSTSAAKERALSPLTRAQVREGSPSVSSDEPSSPERKGKRATTPEAA